MKRQPVHGLEKNYRPRINTDDTDLERRRSLLGGIQSESVSISVHLWLVFMTIFRNTQPSAHKVCASPARR